MTTSAERYAVSRLQRGFAFRALAVVVLVASLGLEILPCAFVECVAVAPGECGGRVFLLEPLQSGADGETRHVELFEYPVLLPRASRLLPSSEVQRHLDEPIAVAPDGFPAAIDHPPQITS